MDFLNLHSTLDILKKKMILIANVFPKLQIANYVYCLYLYANVYFLFNSLFTVDFSIVITTSLHRLTENFIIKRKI